MRFATLSHRFKRQILSRIQLVRIALLILLLVFAYLGWKFVYYPLASSALPQTAGRTNILLLGISGDDYDSPDLTDTIMLLSLPQDKSKYTILSLPRDLWIPSLKAKINAAYYQGKQKKDWQSGLLLAKASVSEVTNQPVHLAIIVDFNAFVTAIDILGGLDINVDKAFDDLKYPIPGKENDMCNGDPNFTCRYERLHFNQGNIHLNGLEALKYSRSRQSEDIEEGTDFARSRRQSKVLSAFITKLFSWETVMRPQIYLKLYRLITTSVIHDLKTDNYFALGKHLISIRNRSITFYSLTLDNHLYHPPVSEKYLNQWVLLPKDDSYNRIHDFVSRILK